MLVWPCWEPSIEKKDFLVSEANTKPRDEESDPGDLLDPNDSEDITLGASGLEFLCFQIKTTT